MTCAHISIDALSFLFARRSGDAVTATPSSHVNVKSAGKGARINESARLLPQGLSLQLAKAPAFSAA